MHCITVQYSVVQCSALQCSAVSEVHCKVFSEVQHNRLYLSVNVFHPLEAACTVAADAAQPLLVHLPENSAMQAVQCSAVNCKPSFSSFYFHGFWVNQPGSCLKNK